MTRPLLLAFLITAVSTAYSCGPGSAFRGSSSQDGKQKESSGYRDSEQKKDTDPGSGSSDPSGSQGAANGEAPPSPSGPRVQTFKFGPSQVITDYVIVIDNSVSMKRILGDVKAGIRNVIESTPNAFPPASRIAVMSTMIGNERDYTKTGSGITRYEGIDLEPGFLSFVSASQIKRYKEKVTNMADKWPLEGCENEWFKPSDKDGQNNFCFLAALQTTAENVGVEAGIHAFKQLLDKNKDRPIFRPNALVNVIFISDTHDPGKNDQELIRLRPSYADIVNFNKNTVNKVIGGLKFHALAPFKTPCSNEVMHDKAYLAIATASGGEQADPCSDSTDYANFFRKMITSSAKREPIFSLENPAATVQSVKVNSTAVTDFKLSEAGDTVVIPSLSSSKDVDVVIEYQPK